ncbi:MAG: nucleotidyltransferase domain-containing protein [archaeon]
MKRITKSFVQKNKEIFDVVMFGSIVRGKENPRDLDIAIILSKELELDRRLLLSQSYRRALEFLKSEIDVQVVSINDLTDASQLARTAIIAEGYSIIHERFLHSLFGFKCNSIFSYDLNGLSDSKKKTLYYALNGRGKNPGILKERNSEMMGAILLKVPLEYTEEFKELFDGYGCKYRTWVSCEYG